ncbi:hypothetical protein T265_14738 [Opisthorchis viverrini]|uniref:long-chain-fatty-acid--CoA ligase n=1 Tax=Opisthorchis viverrini TaxID=6198 RepID=A0A074Z6Y8_OPIVI|nr:hypothetical protein T265_14738 [Opisthorchis viverrini]KER22956.1 hypothetical protein T265_14738 [Opisthorchis viverrini]
MLVAESMNLWLTDQLAYWTSDPYTAFRLTTAVLATCTAYYWYTYRFRTRHIKPSPFLEKQSIILNDEKGIRGSALLDTFPRDDKMETYYDLFCRGLELSRHKPCLGRRYSFDDPIEWWTYEQVDELIRIVGSGLTHLAQGEPRDHELIVGIYGKNTPEWVLTMLACSAYSFVALPLYETLGFEAMEWVCHQAIPFAVVCDTIQLAKNLLKWTRGSSLYIIVIRACAEFEEFRREHSGPCRLLTLKELQDGDRVILTVPGWRHYKIWLPTDVSGVLVVGLNPDRLRNRSEPYADAQGLPKGVLFSHKNCVLATFCGTHILVNSHNTIDFTIPSKTTFLYAGGRIGFLTDDVTGLLQDLQAYRPCYLTSVPRVLIRVYNQVLERVSSSKILLRLFHWAIKRKVEEMRRGVYRRAGILDYIFFKPVRDKTGGNVQILVSASAPIADDVLNFTRAAFAAPVIECYGLTETSGILSATLMGDLNPGHTGTPYIDFQIKLIDVPEMNLVVKRDGMGEICAKGSACTKGYYKDEENTKKLFESDGFLLTGDIGTWTPEGSLKVVDRRKSFFKLAQGEYVTPKKIEEIYSSSTLVGNIYVDGDSHQFYVVAIVEPNFVELRKRLEIHSNGMMCNGTGTLSSSDKTVFSLPVAAMTDKELCENEKVRELVLNELTEIGKERGLKGFEQVKAIHLSVEAFTVANGMLTPTMKVARPNVRRYFAPIIQGLYDGHK